MSIEVKEFNGKKYKVSDDTWYNEETPDDIIILLQGLRVTGRRVRFHWGDIKTGLDWGDVHDVTGRIGRSTGSVKIPILVYNRRSIGGSGILTHCVVKVTMANGKDVIWEHPKYHVRAA